MITNLTPPVRRQRRRILFDGSVLANGPMDGIRRYTLELLKALGPQARKNFPDWEIRVSVDGMTTWPLEQIADLLELESLQSLSNCVKQSTPTVLSEMSRFASRMTRSVVKRLPFRRDQFDLLHLPLPNSYALYQHYTAPLVVTVHDLCHVVCPEFQLPKNIETLQNGIDHAIRRNASFIADSNSTARELEDLADVERERTRTIHLACNRDLFRPIQDQAEIQRVREKYKLPAAPYLFSLCTLEPRKNLLGLVKAFRVFSETEQGANCHLVLAGRAGWGEQEKIIQTAASNQVHLTGRVADEDLPVLYSQAQAFVCMSYYEGFCLPLLEAMTCGCPVIHSDRSAMPEVANGAGLQAPPDDLELILQRLLEVHQHSGLREKMKQKSLKRANDFSWEKTAEQVLTSYLNCLQSTMMSDENERRKVAA